VQGQVAAWAGEGETAITDPSNSERAIKLAKSPRDCAVRTAVMERIRNIPRIDGGQFVVKTTSTQ
jgi:hypothetical protein